MDTTNSSRELHLTVANEDYLECMVRIESEEGGNQRRAIGRHRAAPWRLQGIGQ